MKRRTIKNNTKKIKQTKRTYGDKVRSGKQMYGPGCCPHKLYK